MEDDDLADYAQQLLDGLDDFLRNAKLVAEIGPRGHKTILAHRRHVSDVLKYYRAMSFYTKRRSHQPRRVPSGPKAGMLVPIAVGAATLTAPTAGMGGAATAMGTGVGSAALVLGQVLLPIAAAALISELTGGSLHDVAGRKLTAAVKELAREMVQLNTLTVVLAITAEAAAALSNEELLETILKAAAAVQAEALRILIAELLKRFPHCASAISSFQAASRALNIVKNNPSLHGGMGGWVKALAKAQGAKERAVTALRTCVLGR